MDTDLVKRNGVLVLDEILRVLFIDMLRTASVLRFAGPRRSAG